MSWSDQRIYDLSAIAAAGLALPTDVLRAPNPRTPIRSVTLYNQSNGIAGVYFGGLRTGTPDVQAAAFSYYTVPTQMLLYIGIAFVGPKGQAPAGKVYLYVSESELTAASGPTGGNAAGGLEWDAGNWGQPWFP